MIKITRILGLMMALALLTSAASAQKTNFCATDSVARIAAATPGNTEVTIKRQECKLILMSENTYNNLQLAKIQADTMRIQSMNYINAVKAEIVLRDSIVQLMSRFQKTQEQVIADYQAKFDKSMQLTADAVKNTDFCVESLKKAKRNNILYAIGGGLVGTLVGVLIGAIAVK